MSTVPAAEPPPTGYARHTRYLAFGLLVAVLIFGALAVVGAVYGIWNRGIHIGEDSLTNEVEARVVEVVLGSQGERALGEEIAAAAPGRMRPRGTTWLRRRAVRLRQG